MTIFLKFFEFLTIFFENFHIFLYFFVSQKSSTSRSEKVNFHLLLNLVGIVLSTIAFIIIFQHKKSLHKRHFTSLHSILGLITFILNYIQLILGIPMKSAYFRQKIFSFIKPVKLRLVHACVGLLVIILASSTQVSAFYSQWVVCQKLSI